MLLLHTGFHMTTSYNDTTVTATKPRAEHMLYISRGRYVVSHSTGTDESALAAVLVFLRRALVFLAVPLDVCRDNNK
jgi:ribosomal protein S11